MPFAAPGQTILTIGGRRQVVEAGAAKTYADFLAHITARAAQGQRLWDEAGSGFPAGAYWADAGAVSASAMTGSSWSSRFYGTPTIGAARIVQHALPDEAAFNAQVSNGWRVFFRVAAPASGPAYVGITRNGYTSASSAATSSPRTITELIRWDGTQAWVSDPSVGGTESPYTW